MYEPRMRVIINMSLQKQWFCLLCEGQKKRNVECFTGDKFRMVLAKTLREDGTPDDGEYNPTDTGPSRADSFEYVMHGKVYRIEGDDTGPDSSRL